MVIVAGGADDMKPKLLNLAEEAISPTTTSSTKMTSATRSMRRLLRFAGGVRRELPAPGGGHPWLIAEMLPAGASVLLASGVRGGAEGVFVLFVVVRVGATGVFPVFLLGRVGAVGVFVASLNASPAAAPAIAPATPAATVLPVLRFGVVGGGVTGLGRGVATPAGAGRDKTFVVFPVLWGVGGAAPSTMGLGSGVAGVRSGLPGVGRFVVSVTVAAGVVGTFEGIDCPGAGGSASQSSSLSVFGLVLEPRTVDGVWDTVSAAIAPAPKVAASADLAA